MNLFPSRIDVGVIANSALYNSHLKLSVGANDILDSVVKIVKEPNPSGTLVVHVKDILEAQGQFKVNPDKKGNGVIVVDLQKVCYIMFYSKPNQFNLPNQVFIDALLAT